MIKRVATGLVLAGLVVASLTLVPVWVFKILVMLLIGAALIEFLKITMPNDKFSMITGLIFGELVAAFFIFYIDFKIALPILLAAFFILVVAHMVYYTVLEGVVKRLGLIVFGMIYLCVTLPAFAWLRESNHGRFLIVLTIAIVALGDTFALAFGKLLGKHKMSPLVSPNKTVEGLIASFFGGVVGAVICWAIFWRELPISFIIILGVVVAFVGAIGDLIESLIKRSYHVKDSGNILPGHGGILDRIDALVFAAPFVYFTFKITGWI